MRRIAIVAGAIAGLLVVAVALIYLFVDVNQFRPAIETDLRNRLHRPVTLGPMSLGLFPLSIRADNVSIGENPGYPTGRPFLTARQIRVRTALLPLLRKQIRVEALELVEPRIEMVRNAAGQWNFSDLTSQSSGGSGPPSFALLQVKDGVFATSELGNPASRAVYEHLDIKLTDDSPGKVFHLNASVQLPGGKSHAFGLEASGKVGVPSAPFQGRLVLTDAPLAGLARFAGSTLPLDGQLTGSAEIQSEKAGTKGSLQFELKNAVAGGKALGFPIRLRGSLQGNPGSEVSRITGSMQAGKVPIALSGEANRKTSALEGSIRTEAASLAEVLGVARLLGLGNLSGTGEVSLEVHVSGPMTGALAFAGSGSLRQASLQAGGLQQPIRLESATFRFDRPASGTRSALNFDLDADRLEVNELQNVGNAGAGEKSGRSPKTAPATSPPFSARGTFHLGTVTSRNVVLSNVRGTCAFTEGILTLSPLSAELFGGAANGGVRMDTTREPTAVNVSFQLSGADANQLLSAATSVRNTLFGKLSAGGDLQMTPGAGSVARSLNGKFNLKLTGGRLAGIGILRELSAIGKFTGMDLNSRNQTDISRMTADVDIANGLANTGNFQMVMEEGSLNAAGTANLVDQALHLRVTAVLNKTISRQVGGTGIGGYLTTVLSNGRGELVIPATVTGTFTNPRFAPDPARLAELKLKNLLPGLGDRSGIQGIIDAISGGASKTKGNPAEHEAVQGIIDLFRKKK